MGLAFSIAEGERIYAVGDVHGRADLLARLISLIAEDVAKRPTLPTRLILLGDVVDRGPESAQIVTRLMRYTASTSQVIVLKGNHEELMQQVLSEDEEDLSRWLFVGGGATLESYGVDTSLIASKHYAKIHRAARRAVPKAAVNWLKSLPLFAQSGDVVFVHAGIRPGVPMSKQVPADLLWAGAPFREFTGSHPFRVIHGHAIHEDGPDVHPYRIGLDTGAYRTGRLTALGLEGSSWWSLST